MKKPAIKFLQVFIYILIAVILVFIIGITRNCSKIQYTSIDIEGFSGGDTLDIAIIFGPVSYYLYSDTISGINREILNRFSSDTKTPVKVWPVADAANAMSKVQSGAFDILASMPLDNNIKQKFLVSESLFLDKLVLVQLSDSVTQDVSIKSSLDLKGKTIHIASGSSALQRLQNLSNEIGETINIIEEEELSDELLCLKVANGSLPYAVVNEKIALELSSKYPKLSFDNPVSFTQFQVWLFNNQDSINYKKFSDWFHNFKKTEDFRYIINKF